MAVQSLTFSALELCERGEYEAAAELSGLTVGEWPETVPDGQSAQAEAILVAGTISSALGSIRQSGDQAIGREMLTESIRLFGDDPRSLVAQSWLVWADYWAGDLDGALALSVKLLQESLDSLTRFRVLMIRSAVYWDQGLSDQAFAELAEMETLYDECGPLAKGKFHNQRAVILRQRGETDRAIVDLDAAVSFFQESSNVRWQAVAANNLAGVYLETTQFDRAREYAEQARKLFHELGDKAYEAEALDQSAQIYLAEAKHLAGEKIKRNLVIKSRDENAKMHRAEYLPNELTRKRGAMMAPLENANHLIRNNPDDAAVLYDLFLQARSGQDNPQHTAELDEVEAMLYAKTTDGSQHREDYRRSRLVHEVTSES